MFDSIWKNIPDFLRKVVVMFSDKSLPKVRVLTFVRFMLWPILPLLKEFRESLTHIFRVHARGIGESVQLLEGAEPIHF